MPGAKITVGNADIDRKLGAILDRLDDPAPLYRDIAELLLNSTRERFLSQTDPTGASWAPLSKDYLKSAEKRGSRFPTAIGRLNGYLFGQLVAQSSADRAEVGSNRVYAAMFQFGGTSFAGQRAGSVRLATDSAGKLLRNKRGGAVFASSKSADFVHRAFATGYYEASVAGRAFLGFSDADQVGIMAAVEDYLSVPA